MGRPQGSYRIPNEKLLAALTEAKGDIKAASVLIGMTRAGIYYRLKKEPMLRYKLKQLREPAPAPEEDTDF